VFVSASFAKIFLQNGNLTGAGFEAQIGQQEEVAVALALGKFTIEQIKAASQVARDCQKFIIGT